MKSADIRRLFLDHFSVDNGHLELPSASLVPSSYDPSVLLNVAGMQPFKPYFSGEELPPSSRVTSCQKCFRTPDIDEVGLTARHMTFFEMLGNFSFGDYFKQGSIEMAWDLVINKLGIDPDKLWVTVHEGDKNLGLDLDNEARDNWLKVGVPEDRIVALGADNFWKAGPTGPCGPCSEIFFDRGPAWGPEGKPGDEGDRYLEFYNLVFMQYTRDELGKLSELPNKNIDTGMGLERITSILQNNVSIFEIDSVRPIVDWAEERSGLKYGENRASTKAMRVLVDHGRSMSFLASDGVTPSNEGRGYVLRRVIRRAIQHADRINLYKKGRSELILHELHQRVVDAFKDHYNELEKQQKIVADILASEEERFLHTLDKGQALFDVAISELKGSSTLSGDTSFKLHDTYGFPIELTSELAREKDINVDLERFGQLMLEQKERARSSSTDSKQLIAQAAKFARSVKATEFVGYEHLSISTQVSAVEPVANDPLERVLIKLERSPFYAEGGGQVSDQGVITGDNGIAKISSVLRFEQDQIIVAQIDGHINAKDTVIASVDYESRTATQANHTATHLLQAALQEVLGDHVHQAGSLVEPNRLRFDFTHNKALTSDEIDKVEKLVAQHIFAQEEVTYEQVPIAVANERGAMMLFGEKYGEVVRMVSVADGDWSLELCGGTHVKNTAQILTMLITSESSVGGGTRRIEAITGRYALEWLRGRSDTAALVASKLGVEVDQIADKADQLQQKVKKQERDLLTLRSSGELDTALNQAVSIGEFSIVSYQSNNLGADELLDLADKVKGKLGESSITILGSALAEDKVSLVVSAGKTAIQAGVHAGNIIKEVAGVVGGGGGGRPNMARAGGKDPSKLGEALSVGLEIVKTQLATGVKA